MNWKKILLNKVDEIKNGINKINKMVAIIKTGLSITARFNYNAQKVKQGIAECIMAVNYPKM